MNQNSTPYSFGQDDSGRKYVPKKKNRLPVILASALILTGLVILIVYLCGYRYIRVVTDEGSIRFLGRVNSTGAPYKGTLTLTDGSKAKVDMEEGKITYDSGDVYEGELLRLRRSGQGVVRMADGTVLEGTFAEDELNGSGRIQFSNGDEYDGELRDGLFDGYGTYRWASGAVYMGYYSAGKRNGSGKTISENGYTYEGTYVNDVKEGLGTETFPNGDTYSGGFAGDVRSGQGTYTWSTGDSYTGQFVNGDMDGQGIYTWAETGRTYTGTFKEGTIVRTVDP